MNTAFSVMIFIFVVLCFPLPLSGQDLPAAAISGDSLSHSTNQLPFLSGIPYPESVLINHNEHVKHNLSLYFPKRIGKQQHFEIAIFTPVNLFDYYLINKKSKTVREDFYLRPINSQIKSLDRIPYFDVADLVIRDNHIYPMVVIFVAPTFKKNNQKRLSFGGIFPGSAASAPSEGKSEWYEHELHIKDIAFYIDGVAQPEI